MTFCVLAARTNKVSIEIETFGSGRAVTGALRTPEFTANVFALDGKHFIAVGVCIVARCLFSAFQVKDQAPQWNKVHARMEDVSCAIKRL